MPETGDPLASVGYLVVASLVTVIGIAGYAFSLVRRLAAARARHAELRTD